MVPRMQAALSRRVRVTYQSHGGDRQLPGGARDSRAVSGDTPGTPRSVWANVQNIRICSSSNLCAIHEPTRVGCLWRLAADSTRVACSTRERVRTQTSITHSCFTPRTSSLCWWGSREFLI